MERGADVSRDVGPPPGEQAPDPSARGHDVLGVQLPRLRGPGGPSVRPPAPDTPAAPAATGLPALASVAAAAASDPADPAAAPPGRGRGVPREPRRAGGSLRGVPRRGPSVRLRRPVLPRLRPRRAERHRLLRGRGPAPARNAHAHADHRRAGERDVGFRAAGRRRRLGSVAPRRGAHRPLLAAELGAGQHDRRTGAHAVRAHERDARPERRQNRAAEAHRFEGRGAPGDRRGARRDNRRGVRQRGRPARRRGEERRGRVLAPAADAGGAYER